MGFFSYQLLFLLTIFMALNATAADAPKTDDNKKPQSWPPERVTRPKPTLPQPTLRSENLLKKAVIPPPVLNLNTKKVVAKLSAFTRRKGPKFQILKRNSC
jgi:hypothetical protein